MKRYLLILTMLAALLLTACGQRAQEKTDTTTDAQTTEQQPETTPGTQPAEQKPETSAQTAATGSARSEKLDLEFMLEGQKETVPATLHTGKGYSLYIPDEGWRLDDRELDDGVFEEIWESTVNEEVELGVLSLGSRTLEQAQAWIRAEEDDYQFQEDKQGGLWGTDPKDRELMEVRFHAGSGTMYAVVYTYPEEAVEGFGARLGVIADTFQVTN